VAAGGVELSAYFQGQAWRTGATGAGGARDASYFIFFQGVAPAGAALELRATGVSIVLNKGEPASKPTGKAVLHLAYFATTGAADTAEVKKGSF
jgi:hypothetical protein